MRTPDFRRLLKVLDRQKTDEPTLFEFFMNDDIYVRLAGPPPDKTAPEIERLAWQTSVFAAAGYDYIVYNVDGIHFTHKFVQNGNDSISLNESAMFSDWEGFKNYPWPDPDTWDYSILKSALPVLPGNMKIILSFPYGLLETITSFFGCDALAYLTYDDPALVKAVCDAAGERMLEFYRKGTAFDSVGAIMYADDYGFSSGLLYSPDFYRNNIFPWVKKITEASHKNGKPAIIHSCGKLDLIMDDIINVLKFDGKHSFEDKIQPIEDAYKQYGGRIACLGGIDVDFLCRASKEEIIERSKKMLALGKTAYALGTGNSVPRYMPEENYFAMLQAAR